MKIAAIIAEYNPFHNGHARHIALTRAAGYDLVVCIMDGHLTQRGELAALSKWSRARAALMNGADIVVELPSLFACRTADKFADAGVRIALAIGADALSFGCETSDTELLRRVAMAEEDDLFRAVLERRLASGESQPRARQAALAAVLGMSEAAIPRGPNAILAVEYIRAIERAGGGIEPVPILREGDYHSLETGEIASAAAIRAAAARGDIGSAIVGLPENCAFETAEMTDCHSIDDLFLHAVRSLTPTGLAQLPDVSEGLENRLYTAALSAASLDDMLSSAKCKRYTRARLCRLSAHALTGLTAKLTAEYPEPRYVRVIGMRRGAARMLGERPPRLPLLRAPELKGDPCFEYECRVTDIWALSRSSVDARRAGREFTEKFVAL